MSYVTTGKVSSRTTKEEAKILLENEIISVGRMFEFGGNDARGVVKKATGESEILAAILDYSESSKIIGGLKMCEIRQALKDIHQLLIALEALHA